MQLQGAEKYHPEKVGELERYVDQQAASDEYSLDANLALLRHMQFSPSIAKIPVLAKVLLKAMCQLPRSDFRTCLMVVPESLLADETVAKLVDIATALETSRYEQFWALVSGNKNIVGLVPGFDAAARQYILRVLGITFQRVHKRVLSSSLQLTGQELDALISQHVKASGWQVTGDVVTLPKNELNSPVVLKRQEMIRFEQIAPVLRSMATTA